ncbi:hypothetical protein [Neosynechococcus sphagnicola]|uniref:hypothetical protein n=1 Tax=Neosynechococcus sphagnicola TaxID=1501145 RepID=UPI0009079E8B|nr:hypothetical protein [Neosynechococcus sphagnicola]
MQSENREPTLGDVLNELRSFKADVDQRFTKLEADVKETNIKFDAYVKASDRLLGVATTIIITAGTVTILSPFVQSVAPAIRSFLGSNAG